MQCKCLRVYVHVVLVFQVYKATFSPYRACQHNIRMVCHDDNGDDAEGEIMEEIPAGGCSYVYLVGDFSFDRLHDNEQLLAIPFVRRTLRVAGLGECDVGPLHPEDEEVTEVRLRMLARVVLDLYDHIIPCTSGQASSFRIHSGTLSQLWKALLILPEMIYLL